MTARPSSAKRRSRSPERGIARVLSRREFLQVVAATVAIVPNGWSRAFAQQKLTQAELLKFDAVGSVTLLHIADVHGQLVPVYFREPSSNLGVGDGKGVPPHLTGEAFLKWFGIKPGGAEAHALTSQDFVALAGSYGRIGG